LNKRKKIVLINKQMSDLLLTDAHAFEHQAFNYINNEEEEERNIGGMMDRENRQVNISSYTLNKGDNKKIVLDDSVLMKGGNGCVITGGMSKIDPNKRRRIVLDDSVLMKGGDGDEIPHLLSSYLLQPDEAIRGGTTNGVGTSMISNPITGERTGLFMTQEEYEGNKVLGGRRRKVGRPSKRKLRKSRKSRKVSQKRKQRKSRKVSQKRKQRKSRKVSQKRKN
jgi:hypothetical protein